MFDDVDGVSHDRTRQSPTITSFKTYEVPCKTFEARMPRGLLQTG